MTFSSFKRAVCFLLLTAPLTGCLFRSHTVEQPISTAPLRTASPAELINFINTQAEKIQSMQATVDIDTSVGGVKKGKVTEYQEIRGYVLVRKPSMLRMIGLYPVVRNKAFDMVSDGQNFRLYIPSKNRLIVGRNDIETHSTKQLENLRPEVIYQALLIRRIDQQNEIAVMENDTRIVTVGNGRPVTQADYVIDVIRQDQHGWSLSRKIVFSRTDLLPHRQLIYNEAGNIVTDAKYDDYRDYNGIEFPSRIEIVRPQEEYDITLNIIKLDLNVQLTSEQFMLEIPSGVDVVNIAQPLGSANSPQARNR